MDREVLPAAQEYRLGVIPWSPLQGGLLGGVIRKENEGVRRLEGRARETVEKLRPQIEQYEAFGDELGHESGDVALAWLLLQPAVTGPIVGPRTMEQLESAVRAVDVKLDDKAWPPRRDLPGLQDGPRGLRLVIARRIAPVRRKPAYGRFVVIRTDRRQSTSDA
ncbi:aldo/keto reductase [Kribbella sp. VKM Ac-2568]|uniref:aldo/keto reductase n=1 Tax=Kribbella sp. VKM Ac-2568 TaxID=2512219 RepID=UPI001F547D43|nr:aldo/keto reductase [Kribbella sp. VKM Ac-2568]